jgi:hypothetical protein
MKSKQKISCRIVKISRRRKAILAAPALGAAAVAPAGAAIVFTPVNGGSGLSVAHNDPFAIYFSVSDRRVQTTYFSEAQFLLQFYDGLAGAPYVSPNPNGYFAVAACGCYYAYKLSAGAGINETLLSFYAAPGYLRYGSGGFWSQGDRGYVGLGLVVSDQKYYGWADVSYNADSSLTLYGFAYENVANTTIQAGAVPEPADAALVGALVAGSAAAFAARRKRKLAHAA